MWYLSGASTNKKSWIAGIHRNIFETDAINTMKETLKSTTWSNEIRLTRNEIAGQTSTQIHTRSRRHWALLLVIVPVKRKKDERRLFELKQNKAVNWHCDPPQLIESRGCDKQINAEQVPVLGDDDQRVTGPDDAGCSQSCALIHAHLLHRATNVGQTSDHQGLHIHPSSKQAGDRLGEQFKDNKPIWRLEPRKRPS